MIDLYVQDVTNLYGLDLRVSFDPTIGQVVDQDPAPGTQIQVLYSFLSPSFILHRETQSPAASPPNCGVWCIWFAGTQLNPTPPANGSGPVARVTFLGLQAGTFPMNWINTQLSAPGGIEITPVNNQPCSVTFIPPLAVTLDSFDAVPMADHILARWTTVSEISNAGFNIYRGATAIAPDQQLNDTLDPLAGAGQRPGRKLSVAGLRCRVRRFVLLLAGDGCPQRWHGDARAGQRDVRWADGGDAERDERKPAG